MYARCSSKRKPMSRYPSRSQCESRLDAGFWVPGSGEIAVAPTKAETISSPQFAKTHSKPKARPRHSPRQGCLPQAHHLDNALRYTPGKTKPTTPAES